MSLDERLTVCTGCSSGEMRWEVIGSQYQDGSTQGMKLGSEGWEGGEGRVWTHG